MPADSTSQLDNAVAAFVEDSGEFAGVSALGDGNINDSYLIRCRTGPDFVLQRINSSVFPDPQGIACNGAHITRHLYSEQTADTGLASPYRFPVPIQTVDGDDWYQDAEGETWRCQSYIDNSATYLHVADDRRPYEAGRLLGHFHGKLSSFDHRKLVPPLPGFHDLNGYRQAYIDAVSVHQRNTSSDLAYCRTVAEARLDHETLEELAAAEMVEKRIIHGDPKCENFLFEADSKQALSLIDFDTAAPGLAAVDIGDCLRSFCNPGGERSALPVLFDLDICRSLLDGYRSAVETTEAERRLVYHGVCLLTYELGLRFFTDYLENDRYFKVIDEEDNLRRAIVQFKLLESIEARRGAVEAAAGC